MAATHDGHCQICNRQHKVTGDRIAKHGYTIRNGWQQGACYGSGGKPIEISCDLLAGALLAAQEYIVKTTANIAHLQSPAPLDEKGRIGVFFYKQTRAGDRTEYKLVTIGANDKGQVTLHDYANTVVRTYKHPGEPKTEDAVVRLLADKLVTYLARTIVDTEENIVYLTERLTNWKPGTLQPVTDADRAASAPKVHFVAAKWGCKRTTACSHSASAAHTNRFRNIADDPAKVTCTACVKNMAEMAERAAAKAAAKT